MRLLALVVAIAMTRVLGAEAARLLAFLPMPAPSHQRVFQPLLTALAARNHSVTVFTPLPIEAPPPNYVQVKLNNYMEEIKESLGLNGKEMFKISDQSLMSKIVFPFFMRKFGILMAERVLQEEAVQRLIHSDLSFDAIILETTFIQECYIAFGHKFNAPVIEILPTSNFHWSYWIHGNPLDTSYICDLQLAVTDEMNFRERLQNTFTSLWMRFVWWNKYNSVFQNIMDKLIRYDGWESRPPLMDMVANTSLVLMNSHFSLNYPYPLSQNFKEVGGINLFPPKKLPEDIQHFMDTAENGVIYFTLGSHIQVSSALDEVREEFSKAFSKLQQKVLWKWETEFPNPPHNVKISKWFPQQDILAHKNIKIFISHGGFLSLTESVYNGVPIIGIPLLADQHKNLVHILHHNYGVQLSYGNLTETSISWAINEVLTNPRYKENAVKRSALFRDKPQTGLETAIYWVEYVLRHDGAHHLKPATIKLSWWQQSLIDVYLTLTLILLVPLYILYKVICLFISKCNYKKQKHKQKKQ